MSYSERQRIEASQKILNGHAIELREQGEGKRTKHADSLVEEEMLWKSGVLGGDNPQSLNYTVFYVVSQHFGTRGCQEHHQIRLEHLKIVKNAEGQTEYMERIEGVTKTRQGLSKRDRRVPQRVFATLPINVFGQVHLQEASMSAALRATLFAPTQEDFSHVCHMVFITASWCGHHQWIYEGNSEMCRT